MAVDSVNPGESGSAQFFIEDAVGGLAHLRRKQVGAIEVLEAKVLRPPIERVNSGGCGHDWPKSADPFDRTAAFTGVEASECGKMWRCWWTGPELA